MLHSTVNNGEGGGWDDVFLVMFALFDIDDLRRWTCFLQGGRTGQWKGSCNKDYREPGGKYKGGQCTLFALHRCSWIKFVDFLYFL